MRPDRRPERGRAQIPAASAARARLRAADADAAVLAIDDHVVEARRAEELDQFGGVGDLLEQRADDGLPLRSSAEAD